MYSFGRSCGRVRFWIHEGQKEKQIERKRENSLYSEENTWSPGGKEKYTIDINYKLGTDIKIKYAKRKEEERKKEKIDLYSGKKSLLLVVQYKNKKRN